MNKLWLNPGLRSLALILLCLALYLPGQSSLPSFDRDESRFAQATHQMVDSGDYINIRFQNEARNKKPIGIYWLQAASVKLLGVSDQIWAYRVPSWLAAIGAVLLTSFIGARFFGPLAGLMAGIMLASCLILGIEARMAKTDAVLLCTVVLSQFVLSRLWLERTLTTKMAVLYWVALGAGILIKGPIIILVTLSTMIVLSVTQRSAAWLKPLQPKWGLPLCLLIVLPWLIAISFTTHGAFWQESVGHDLLGKAAGQQESHGAPPGSYLVAVFLTFWPWAALLLPASYYSYKQRREPKVQFMLAWIIPFWLMFELFPTKLLHYTMPVFPALALLCAAMLTDAEFHIPAKLKRATLILGSILLVAIAAAAPLAPAYAFPMPMQLSMIAIGAGMLLIAGSVVACNVRKTKPLLASGILLVTLVDFYAAVYAHLLPNMDQFWVSRSVAELTVPYRDACPGPVVTVGYNEPSLIFLLGADTILATEVPPTTSTCQLVLVEQKQLQGKDINAALGQIHGFNYSRGKEVAVYLFRQQTETAEPVTAPPVYLP